MMKGTPEYAKLLLSTSNSRADLGENSRLDLLRPVGPLGYRVGDTTVNESPSIPQQQQQQQKQKKNPVEMLQQLGGSATAALMAGAVATYPYWMPLLGGKRRKKRFVQRFGRGGNPEISSDWLA